jgi:hypothetical protein
MVFIYCGAPIRLHVSINRVRVMEFNAAFNNISVISWRSVLLVKEIEENYQPAIGIEKGI